MMVTLKSKDGYNVDVTRMYMMALEKKITPQVWEDYCIEVQMTNKNI